MESDPRSAGPDDQGLRRAKIDLIEERLSNIEDLLRSLTNNPQSVGDATWDASRVRHATPSASTVGDVSILTHDGADSDSAFEGELSLTAHTMFASDFIENAVQRTSLQDVAPNMHAALSALRQIVSMQSRTSSNREFRFRTQQSLPPGGLADLPMPPMNAVVALLKHMKVSPPSIFSLACSFLDVDDLAELCRRVYFCTDNFADTTFIIVNGALFYLFMEQAYLAPDGTSREEFESYQHMCRNNLETALACLPLMLPAKVESIEALLIAAVYSVDVSNASLAWLFTSTAASLCQTLGYHRVSQARSDSAGPRDIKTLLFWHVYMLDKTLSLRTGRASVIQDWDVTLPRRVDNTMVADPWGAIITIWIKQSEIQQRVYEQLAILLTPFTPFFVLFCHVIDTSSASDLKRLNEFVGSLRPACALSEPVERLHQLCSMLCNVATLYVEGKSQQSEERDPVNDEFDVYLSALGFPPTECPAQGMDTGEMSQPTLQTAQLGNWFSGSQYMMGLLEEDLSQFN
ncbi:fungal specific transcription factor [Colletotrichum higginsianum]|uniref:Fungal specific transcription factor n=1 Tax=Colletotrichum higginsianum (strain IMI 349063) TaxID=759273 RepID=H1UY29_COLHI|nr:fungal specific transcription factor [Colletotrichum higginsianum]